MQRTNAAYARLSRFGVHKNLKDLRLLVSNAAFLIIFAFATGAIAGGPPELPWHVKIVPAGRGLSVEQESRLLRVTEARQLYSVTGKTCSVAIIDSGIYAEHKDFTDRVAVQLDFTDPEGYAPRQGAADGLGHGTAVAGIIAGNRPGPDIGIAPDTTILALRVFDLAGSTSWKAVAAALRWVDSNLNAQHICAVNLSLGDPYNYQSESQPRADADYRDVTKELDALYACRVPVVVASGNRYMALAKEGMVYPAILHTVVSVGAVSGSVDSSKWVQFDDGSTANRTGPNLIAPFSQRLLSTANSQSTKIFAPGAYITTASRRGPSQQDQFSGTSDATPLVSGVIVLMREYYGAHSGQALPPDIDALLTWLRSGIVANDQDVGQDHVPHTGKPFFRLDALCALNAEAASLANPHVQAPPCT